MCAIVGIAGTSHAAPDVYEALTILQHKGQDAAGIAACGDGKITVRKARAMVHDTFSAADMLQLRGPIAIGHVRYPTAGCGSSQEAQPLYVNHPAALPWPTTAT